MTSTAYAQPAELPGWLDDDVLLFIHIPKTGGTSLASLLDSFFPSDRIFPLHSAKSEAELMAHLQPPLRSYRLVRGHYTYGRLDDRVYKHIVQSPRIVTVLRDPLARVVSLYRHVGRVNSRPWMQRVVKLGQSLREFVEDPAHTRQVVNAQTRLVVGAVRPMAPSKLGMARVTDAALLGLAKEHLEQFALVGITERFEDTVTSLCTTFGWQPPAVIPHLNVAGPDRLRRGLDDDTLAALQARTSLDQELYTFARARFEARGQAALARSMEV